MTDRYTIAAQAFSIAWLCQPHLHMLAEHRQLDIQPYTKLLNKTQSWLQGELKSGTNLQRFFEAFADWREQLTFEDTLADSIADLSNAALFCATEACLAEANEEEWQLLCQFLQQLQHTEGLDGSGLEQYWQELTQELLATLPEQVQRPLPKDFFLTLRQQPITPFGVDLQD
ncbi:hypothetical protein CHH28_14175 [Bacterioplanes sanyensis]|uniref:DUF416 domain-containing protein n=1 Tax=Bacterioplanes sanyensis TaxID=1249553 RepID=A0A222FL58_9GAMM|nr:hypothetical protein [Bacterioplanes sanyensis]ASP39748.1 hypothetical protein CHH28_14175 [Bacterioplanes sanyensis]